MRDKKRDTKWRKSSERVIKGDEGVSYLWKQFNEDEVAAVCCSDIHLQDVAPIARSPEPDWYEAMLRPMLQVNDICNTFDVPLIIAGDIFNKAESRPKLINFAMAVLPKVVYAIPGQHDLPNHRMDNVEKSAYWTLVRGKKIKDITTVGVELECGIHVYGFGWKQEIESHVPTKKNVAIIHSYIWNKPENSYQGAPKDARTKAWTKVLLDGGYTAAVFGDNHKGFHSVGEHDEPEILNCGTLMRRNIDEINYKPFVGLLLKDCTFHQVFLNTEEDKFIDIGGAVELAEKAVESAEFIRELVGLGRTLVNFKDALFRFCDKNNVSESVRSLLAEVVEDK